MSPVGSGGTFSHVRLSYKYLLFITTRNSTSSSIPPPRMFSTLIISVICAFIGSAHGVFEANKCLSNNAFYNDTSLQCQCDAGYKGLGDLCCDNTNEWANCNFGGDPWLSTYDGTRFPYNMPCSNHVAMATGTTGSGSKCTVEVLTGSKMVEKGALYPDRVSVCYTIEDGKTQIFRFVGDTIQSPGATQASRSSDLYRKRLNRVQLSGERFVISYLSSRRIWTIKGCDTKVTFRAAEGTDAVQYNRPGVCMSVLKSSGVQPTGQVTAGDMCSATSSYGGATPEQLPYTVLADAMVAYNKLSNEGIAIQPEYESTCSKVQYTLEERCSDKNKMRSAVYACASVFYSSPIKLCMSTLGTTGPQAVDFFGTCLALKCDPDSTSCGSFVQLNTVIKTCIPSFCEL